MSIPFFRKTIDFKHTRFDKKSIRNYFPQISASDENRIIDYKENCFYKYLQYNYAIAATLHVLYKAKRFSKKAILLTSGSKKRINHILTYFNEKFSINLMDYFSHDNIYFKEDIGCINKYDFIFNKLPIDNFTNVAILEDDEQELRYLIQKGLHEDQLFTGAYPRFFQIKKNSYLSQTTDAYFHSHYSNRGKLGNPDYICTLKNDNNKPEYTFRNSQIKLAEILFADFALLKKQINFDMICMVPRSKKENFYTLDQQIIRKIVSETAQKLSVCDGTKHIIRNINTRTTHRFDDIDGKMPFKGITKSTCYISDDVKDKNILLVDDIYTETVNIDEDAIQALLDKGAKNVTFYAVAKTIKK